ncbi:ABC transporter ATP-binding protein [Salinicola tamaricis]|uniref:ABC transporter ATP-binding protein n=1 Tax=Salinicola tamaricis TaxID=1771309 RepID=UPI003BF48F5A
MALLEVDDLSVHFTLPGMVLETLAGVSFRLGRGDCLGIVGESGAGKSVLGFSLVNLLAPPGRIVSGRIRLEGRELTTLSERHWRAIRGRRMAMVFQDPCATLNPVLTVGQQMHETLRAHRRLSRRLARRMVLHRLHQVGLEAPESQLSRYPHQLSGGQCQRVVIAMALLLDPDIIIADEPTTALDVTTQAELVALLASLCRTLDLSLIVISHDLTVIQQLTQRVLVMYAGRVVESGPTRRDQRPPAPLHPGAGRCPAADVSAAAPLRPIPGSPPAPGAAPTGCAFHPRCRYRHAADDELRRRCEGSSPALIPSSGSEVACHWVARLIDQETSDAVEVHDEPLD